MWAFPSVIWVTLVAWFYMEFGTTDERGPVFLVAFIPVLLCVVTHYLS